MPGRMSIALVVCLLVVSAAAQEPQETAAAPQVRADHPRVMLTPEAIEVLKDRMIAEPIPGKDAAARALTYVLTGDEAALKDAVDYMTSFDVPEEVLTSKVASDEYRWAAAVPVIYDWCRDKLNQQQRTQFLERYGRIVEAMNAKPWGGPSMPGSNYYAGYMRNSGIFGLAAFGETPVAQKALEDALVTRWEKSSLPYYQSAAKGGVIGEGSQYDRYNIGYVLWLAEAVKAAMGRNLFAETNFLREFAYQTIFSTTPTLTYAKGIDDPYFQRFPFGDCEMWQGHPIVDEYIGDAMRLAAREYADEKVGKHAQAWLDEVEPPKGLIGWMGYDPERTEPGDLSELPVDYYAPGAGFAYLKSGWDEGATELMLQLSVPQKGSHYHLDAGSFQMLRAGRWMTKESTGYGTKFKDCTARDALAHNVVVFDGRGQANGYPDGEPEIIAIEKSRDFFHAAVDLTRAYRASSSPYKDRDDNPGCGKIVREFVYVKPDLVIIFDRLLATSPGVKISSLIHFPVKPVFKKDDVFGELFIGENGGSQLVVHHVYPADVKYETIDEGDVKDKSPESGYYQWRVEASQTGKEEAYFMTVVAALERFDLEPQCTLIEKENTIGATISQPGRKVEVHFNKKTGESLGKLAIDAAGAYGHSDSELPMKVQTISVGPDGPAWGPPLEREWPIDPGATRRR